jgi:hypothetical protein
LVLTLLSSANARGKHLQVPSRHHGEVRVVAGLGFLCPDLSP